MNPVEVNSFLKEEPLCKSASDFKDLLYFSIIKFNAGLT